MLANLDDLKSGQNLTQEQMQETMATIMDGHASDTEIKDFLLALSDKGESVDEITGAANVLRQRASTISAPYGTVDCCGTGGDKRGTYNISTAVALVVAACGVIVAKHGNRAASSKSGAADVLEVLGVKLDPPHEVIEAALDRVNFAFLMAPQHHKAMRHVAAVRKEIGQRTIFNVLGPLANPAGTKHQLIGVYDRSLVRPLAEVLRNLGTKRAWVVHGEDGLDEITICGNTYVAKLDEDGNITEETLSPQDFGLETLQSPEDLTGGDAQDNAKALRALLEGRQCAYRDIVLANAAAVLCITGRANDLLDAMTKAKAAIDNGFAKQVLHDYVSFSRKMPEDL